ncbi:N-acetylmuramoyl-L-alanine amidase [Pseudoroseicyclus tamaricis]|uniref:N-acetylmuramoyl-L-alanine amidase n=1 Tax=Pseudoroseicyclus tamaricis TaxID=2705421 RepID=A0A6B2JVD8_9RHOB|nr:N-acetylmuramoyl-L-alanine amidase [Pseudoroseicyclus tamaricis]NDV02467.1 N-acetylmuramoyl-L-alanine amidase [Pseudoroseicyclus tamaricis]
MVVLHYTVLDLSETLDRLCDPAAEVSAHYVIAGEGEVLQLVGEERRAWHAGAGRWGGVADVNSHSLGIELVNDGRAPFPAPQMLALERLLAALMARHDIPPERVIGHSDMAPGRKSDPGPRFDWRRLARQRLSVWPASGARAPLDELQPALVAFGYDSSLGETARLSAFRRRFFPGRAGPPAADEAGAAVDLARRFPVDAKPARA